MATIERLGRRPACGIPRSRTDTEALTKKKLEYNAKNLDDFDAVVFFTGGSLEMDAQQKPTLYRSYMTTAKFPSGSTVLRSPLWTGEERRDHWRITMSTPGAVEAPIIVKTRPFLACSNG